MAALYKTCCFKTRLDFKSTTETISISYIKNDTTNPWSVKKHCSLVIS